MKLILVIFTSLVLILAILFYHLPDSQTKEVKKSIRFKNDKIWYKIRDLKNQKTWREDIDDIKIISEKNPESWIEILKTGQELKFQTLKIIESEYWELNTFENSLFETNWVGKLKYISENETEISFTETFKMKNFFSKIIFYLFFDLEKMILIYLKDLETSLKQEGL